MRSTLFLSALCLCLSLISMPGVARADCGASIVTGIDVSASISRDDLVMQVDGIGAALQSPAVLSAIQSQGCARMAVFVWSDTAPVVLLPWMDIASADDAVRAMTMLETSVSDYELRGAGLTAVGQAMEFAWHLLNQVPPTGRQIVNIVTNGESNEGPHPSGMRDQMHAAGIVVNAVVFGDNLHKLVAYYHANVVTGRGRFVMTIDAADDMAAAFRSKFVLDLASVQ